MIPARYLRRGLTLSLMALCASYLPACTTPGVMCDMKTEYHESAMSQTGNVRLAWRFESEVKDRTYGLTDCYATDGDRLCLVKLKGPPPKFSDVCGLAKFGHEVAHAMNAAHD